MLLWPSSWLWIGLLAAAGTGCATPTLTVESTPPDARILVDGVGRGAGTVAMRQPYYGTIDVTAVTPVPRSEKRPPASHTRAAVRLDEPVTPWIFPFDLLGEVVLRAWQVPAAQAQLVVPPRAEVVAPFAPHDGALRSRAAEMRTAR